MPSRVRAAESNDLKPIIGLVRRLMKRWSCSIMLFRYFDFTVLIFVGQPNLFSILLTSFVPAPLAPLLSITMRKGMPLLDKALAKNLVTVKGHSLRSVEISPTSGTQSNDAFHMNGDTTVEEVTLKDFYYNSGNDTGYGFRFVNNMRVYGRSPYIRNVSVITKGTTTSNLDPRGFDSGDAGRGAFIDGSVADSNSNEASMLFHSVTFITPGVSGMKITNGSRVEWLNFFTYFAGTPIKFR